MVCVGYGLGAVSLRASSGSKGSLPFGWVLWLLLFRLQKIDRTSNFHASIMHVGGRGEKEGKGGKREEGRILVKGKKEANGQVIISFLVTPSLSFFPPPWSVCLSVCLSVGVCVCVCVRFEPK